MHRQSLMEKQRGVCTTSHTDPSHCCLPSSWQHSPGPALQGIQLKIHLQKSEHGPKGQAQQPFLKPSTLQWCPMTFWRREKKTWVEILLRCHTYGHHCHQYSYSGCINLSLHRPGVQMLRGMKERRKDKGKNERWQIKKRSNTQATNKLLHVGYLFQLGA